MKNDIQVSSGGSFLIREAGRAFVPELLTAEDRAIGKVASDFLRNEVLPRVDAIEAGDHALMHRLMRRAGELGLLGVEVPTVYGGLGLKVSTAAYIAEKLNFQQSFALTHEAHTVIATLPLLYFGNHDQKSRYLPKLASGEWIGSFALSEANAGSDALAADTKAWLDGDHYILNGMKMWITNTGFAQLFTVFARIVDPPGRTAAGGGASGFTAFLVERDYPGVSYGQEERKLGMRGTSTRRIIFDDVRVPIENALEVGKGQYAAFCALNMGRFKLEAGAVGGLKEILAVCARYAQERRAFKKTLGEFGLVQHKLAEMASRIFALESMVYRLAGDLDRAFDGIAADAPEASAQFHRAAEEFAIECNIVKVIGSEAYSRITDEAIQIHGGYGYTENFPAARAWRDQRLLRIGEGANEIVRLAIINLLLRRDAQGRLGIKEAAAKAREAVDTGRLPMREDGFRATAADLRLLALYLMSAAAQRHGAEMMDAQETAAAVADVVCSCYAVDSVRLRYDSMTALSKEDHTLVTPAAGVAVRDYVDEAVTAAKIALDSLVTSAESWRDQPRSGINSLLNRLERPSSNPVSQRRDLAKRVLDSGGYPFR